MCIRDRDTRLGRLFHERQQLAREWAALLRPGGCIGRLGLPGARDASFRCGHAGGARCGALLALGPASSSLPSHRAAGAVVR
eukprot:10600961-Alexandrium_andersonii.AAC.1